MSLSLYTDVQVPAALTEALRKRSLDVQTSQEDGTRTWADEAILARAVELDRLLLTQDEDFLAIGAEWQRIGREFPGVFFARQGLPIGRLTRDLELYLSCCTAEELRNRVIHLPIQ